MNRAADWPWSSCRATAGLEEPPAFLITDWLLGQFAQDRKGAQRAYRRFVAEGVESSPWEGLRGQVFLGSEEFVKGLSIPKGEELKEVPQAQWLAVKPSLEEIFRGYPAEEGIALAYRRYGYRLREIAEYLGVHYATVSRRLRRFEQDQGPLV